MACKKKDSGVHDPLKNPYDHADSMLCTAGLFPSSRNDHCCLGVAAYFVYLNSDVEYEYLYVDKELTVDKVMAKSRRKRVATYDLGKIEILAPIKSWHLDNYKNRTDKTVDYSSGEEKQPDRRFAFFYDGKQRVLIEPNEEMIKAMQTVAPRKVFKD